MSRSSISPSRTPTRAAFIYPAGLLDALSAPAALDYRPEPLGLSAARQVIAGYLRRYELDAEAGRVVLTASTSDAYAALFKLLCDPGDEVLVPHPKLSPVRASDTSRGCRGRAVRTRVPRALGDQPRASARLSDTPHSGDPAGQSQQPDRFVRILR